MLKSVQPTIESPNLSHAKNFHFSVLFIFLLEGRTRKTHRAPFLSQFIASSEKKTLVRFFLRRRIKHGRRILEVQRPSCSAASACFGDGLCRRRSSVFFCFSQATPPRLRWFVLFFLLCVCIYIFVFTIIRYN
jgi:hypothetical protein